MATVWVSQDSSKSYYGQQVTRDSAGKIVPVSSSSLKTTEQAGTSTSDSSAELLRTSEPSLPVSESLKTGVSRATTEPSKPAVKSTTKSTGKTRVELEAEAARLARLPTPTQPESESVVVKETYAPTPAGRDEYQVVTNPEGSETKYTLISPSGKKFPTDNPNFRPRSEGYIRVAEAYEDQTPAERAETRRVLEKGGISKDKYIQISQLPSNTQRYLAENPEVWAIPPEAVPQEVLEPTVQTKPAAIEQPAATISAPSYNPYSLALTSDADIHGKLLTVSEGLDISSRLDLPASVFTMMSAGIGPKSVVRKDYEPPAITKPKDIPFNEPYVLNLATVEESAKARTRSQNILRAFALGIAQEPTSASALHVPYTYRSFTEGLPTYPAEFAYQIGQFVGVPITMAELVYAPQGIWAASKTAVTSGLKVAGPTFAKLSTTAAGRSILNVGTNLVASALSYKATEAAIRFKTWTPYLSKQEKDMYYAGQVAASEVPGFWQTGILYDPLRKYRREEAYIETVRKEAKAKGYSDYEAERLVNRLQAEPGIRNVAWAGGTLTSGAVSEAFGQVYVGAIKKTILDKATESIITLRRATNVIGKAIEPAGQGEGAAQELLAQYQSGEADKYGLFEPYQIRIAGVPLKVTRAEKIVAAAAMGGWSSKLISKSVFKYSVLKQKAGRFVSEVAGYGLDWTEAPTDWWYARISESSGLPGVRIRPAAFSFSFAPSGGATATSDVTISSNILSDVPAPKSSSLINILPFNNVPVPVNPTPEVPVPIEPTPFVPVPVNPTPIVPVPVNPTPEVPVPVNPKPDVPVPPSVIVPTFPYFPISAPGWFTPEPAGYEYERPTRKQYEYQADFMAMVLGQYTSKKPEFRAYTGEERRLIYRPESTSVSRYLVKPRTKKVTKKRTKGMKWRMPKRSFRPSLTGKLAYMVR